MLLPVGMARGMEDKMHGFTTTTAELKDRVAAMVDDYGHLAAQLATLEARKEGLRAQLLELGAGAYEGALFRVTVSESERETLDMKAVREHLSRQFIQAHTTTKAVATVRCAARSNAGL
jgi:hypothetical protein